LLYGSGRETVDAAFHFDNWHAVLAREPNQSALGLAE
jgi:hypothetical protein